MGIFLRLPHWVIFILTFGLFLFLVVALTLVELSIPVHGGQNIDKSAEFQLLRVTLLMPAISLIFANFWRYAIGTRLHKRRHYDNFMLMIFRWCIYFSTLLHAARLFIFHEIDYFNDSTMLFANVIWIGGGIYCDYFLARMLVSVEYRRDVSFNDYSRTFFSFLFFPIGVWWLQPRINKIFKDGDEVDLDTPLDYKLEERS